MKKAHFDVIIYKIGAVSFLKFDKNFVPFDLAEVTITTQTLKALDPCHHAPV